MENDMSVKSDILAILEQHRNDPISGELIAEELNVSRAYVWKVIKKLKEEGYEILATPNLGYLLADSTDVISSEGIKPYLDEMNVNLPLFIYKTIDSTNTQAKKMAMDGAPHGTVLIAEEQTAGRGRRGRNFYSMSGLGIYMSFILRPELTAQDSVLITTAASVCVSRAIEQVTGIKTSIKWVNDLFYNKYKVCGILTEAVTDLETGGIDSLILGIGINYCLDSETIPKELKEIVGSLFHQKPTSITRNQLCAALINEVLNQCNHLTERDFLQEYKEKSLVLGSRIQILGNNEVIQAQAIDIDSSGGLIVRYDSGEIATLNSGEISIRTLPTTPTY